MNICIKYRKYVSQIMPIIFIGFFQWGWQSKVDLTPLPLAPMMAASLYEVSLSIYDGNNKHQCCRPRVFRYQLYTSKRSRSFKSDRNQLIQVIGIYKLINARGDIKQMLNLHANLFFTLHHHHHLNLRLKRRHTFYYFWG